MQEDARCHLCEIPEHHSTGATVAAAVAPTPSTARRQRHAHQLHSNPITHPTSHEEASASEPIHSLSNDLHTLGQFTNLNYRYSPRHTITEDPTFIRELSSYMRRNHRSYDEEPSRGLNNQNLNFTKKTNKLSEEHYPSYKQEPEYKINNLPRVHTRSRSNSYNNQILNPKTFYEPVSSLQINSKSNTLPNNVISRRHGSHLSMMHDVDQDYFLRMQQSRFSLDSEKRREAKKQRMNAQSVMLIGCFALMFVVGIIMFVAVCYQNGWLGLGRGQSRVDNISRRHNEELHRIHKPISNFPNVIQQHRATDLGRSHLDYPRIGLSGVRPHPSIYEDRVYQQLPQFARLVDDRAVDEHQEIRHTSTSNLNNPINELPRAERLVDNHKASTVTNTFFYDNHPNEDLQMVEISFRNEETSSHEEPWNFEFSDNEQSDFDEMGQIFNSDDNFAKERLVNTHIPDIHDIQLSFNGSFEESPTSNVQKEMTNTNFGLRRDEETILLHPSSELNITSQENSSFWGIISAILEEHSKTQ